MRNTLNVRRRGFRALLGAAAAVSFVACSSDKSSGPEAGLVSEVITQVGVAGTSATAQFHSSAAPQGGSSGPAATANVESPAVVGGSARVVVSAAAAFTRVIVTLEDKKGYYEVTLPQATTTAALIVSVAPDVDLSTLAAAFAVGAQGGGIGAYAQESIQVIQVGTGDVQVSVSWDAESDVDLHVVDPSGEEIYYGNETSASGGQLDLDSNAGCAIDGKKNENVTWPTNGAPRGTYTVRVDYWSSCGVAQTNYVVTVRVKGQQTRTFTGTFTGAGTGGGQGDGVTITTFTY